MSKILNSSIGENQGSSLKKKVLNSSVSENQGSSLKKKVLIIEDEKILGEMYRDKFIQSGFDVKLVDSTEEGIKIIKKERFDLVLLDILLPEANGIQFLKKLKEISEAAAIPVVAFSNYDDPETKQEAAKLGVKDYLIKTNYTPQEIIEKIRGYLNGKDN